ncbi:eukaryotic translation initiation factor 4 gamma 1-like [Takifugu rubripes]|uniref:eukaryotic translation initiation factor 4 gamma 1-like n=1 Tax=Takifugu rubripes TaxID=31033 RepID=UPI00114553C1|nr:eukaryotic translation initiation factor 4 gamma 1-like [Takifugu rubripes]
MNTGARETPEAREPVGCLEEQKINRGAQIKDVNKITVEHKTPPKGGSSKPLSELMAKEEAPAQDCGEEDVYRALKRLLQNNSGNDKIEEWIQNTLNDRQRSSDGFVRALIRAVCQSVIVDCGVRTYELLQRASLLKRFIKDDHKQLVVHIDQPDGEYPSIHLDGHGFVHFNFEPQIQEPVVCFY